MLYVETGI
jgi:hypothetical protein